MKTDIDYLRGLLGARLANKDNWIIVLAGSKAFVNFVANRPMPMFKGALIIRPHALVAGDVAGHPELWVMIGAQPKETDPIEVERERSEMEEILRLMGGYNKSIRPDQDIFLIIEPKAPRWAGNLVGNYLEFIRTGEGAMEPTNDD